MGHWIKLKLFHWWLQNIMMTSSNGNIFPRYWPLVRGIHRSPVNSPHKGQWRGALMFSLICVWINGWVNNREAGDLRRYRAHYDVIGICSADRRKRYPLIFATNEEKNNSTNLSWEEKAGKLQTIFHWRLFCGVWFMRSHDWFRWRFGSEQAASHYI